MADGRVRTGDGKGHWDRYLRWPARWACGAALFVVATTVARGQEPVRASEGRVAVRRDPHSNGNPAQVRVTHVALDLTIDFARKELRGAATLLVERQPGSPPGSPLLLDTKDLAIEAVDDPARNVPVAYELGKADPILGSVLTIRLPDGASRVRVAYHTSPQASALQWVGPTQTAGGRSPFLFSQSEAIHARAWIPLQDSPAVRVTYEATLRIPKDLVAVMSADARGHDAGVYHFSMPQAIPSYLIALAVGDLASRPLGTRTGVWAEPPVIEKAAHEFGETERMLEVAERQCGPYRWGRYDILVLPPSFPFGGMENAKVTFATPTVLAGDRSLVALIAHELSHSWSGNLVTNATWSDVWLNEGMTTYLERRIVEGLYGRARADMQWTLGGRELRDELERLDDRDEVLHIDLANRNPEDAITRVPYEKGALFLTRLEQAFGRETFDPFVKGYFDHFAFQSITTADFEEYLRARLFSRNPAAAEKINLHAWVHEPGLPADAPVAQSERFTAVADEATRFAAGEIAAKSLHTADWSTLEWIYFLKSLPPRLTTQQMAELDRAFGFTSRENTEVAEQWLLLAIRTGYAPADERIERFLTTIGRRKYLVPLYQALARTPEGKARALKIYEKARPLYHPIAAEAVDGILKGARK